MDTRWKKWKIVVSFTALILGTVLLVGNFLSMVGLIVASDMPEDIKAGPQNDYQDTREFSDYLSLRLEDLIGAAIGGWENYGVSRKEGYYSYESTATEGSVLKKLFPSSVQEPRLEIATEEVEEVVIGEVIGDKAGAEHEGSTGYDVKTHMEELARDKNLCYAVMYRGVLTYTNIDTLEPKLHQKLAPWGEEESVLGDEYNFSLWYNRDGDGKVTAAKDGEAIDIYGDGLYTADSKWFVPGYTNFTVDESAKDAVVFMAALKEPRLYITGNDSGYGSNQYGGRLYYLARAVENRKTEFRNSVLGLLAALLLLILARVFRKERKAFTSAFFRRVRLKELRLPIQKRLVRRQRRVLWSAVCSMALIGLLWLSLISGDYNYYGYGSLLAGVTLFSLIVTFLFVLWNTKRSNELAVDMGALDTQITIVREGNLQTPLVLPEEADLRAAAEKLNTIQAGLEEALRERIKSERMKVELVANVSHDIKTPLTSIISYIELLKQEEELPDYVKDYIRILGEKSERLKTMVQDVFEVSKAASGDLPVNSETLDLGKLLRQTLADMAEQIEASPVSIREVIPEEPIRITADGQRLYRVFQNLLLNALKYSLSGSRVYVTLVCEEHVGGGDGEGSRTAVASIKNTSGTELPADVDFTERFVRGDKSRTDGGSGLGLSIARSFTEACGGSFKVETDADLFTVTVSFPVSSNRVDVEA